MYINVFPTLYYVFSIYLVSKNMQDPWQPMVRPIPEKDKSTTLDIPIQHVSLLF